MLSKLCNFPTTLRPSYAGPVSAVHHTVVVFQHNLLTKLERGAFGRLPVVFELNLAHNLLNNVTSRAFEGLLQLLALNLTANNLTTIPNGAFQGEQIARLRSRCLTSRYEGKLVLFGGFSKILIMFLYEVRVMKA
jgi:hypothetical protein